MKRRILILMIFVIIVALAIPGTVFAEEIRDDKIVFGGSYTLKSGESIEGNLLILGSVVTLEENSSVKGDVVLLGGTINVDGTIEGNLVGVAGVVTLGEKAIIEGDLIVQAASVTRDPAAQINGQVVTGFQIPPLALRPGQTETPVTPRIEFPVVPVWKGFWFLFRTFLWAAVAVIVTLFLPNPVERVSRAIAGQPILSGGVGLVTVFIAPLLLILMAITLILIPVSLLGVILLAIAWFFGRIAIGLLVGKKLGVTVKQDWPAPLAAGLGTFCLVLVVDGIGTIVPCVGWLVPAVVGLVGLGGVLLTRFATQSYPPSTMKSLANPPIPPDPIVPLNP
jgi:cytoskeletal protein CcmA (bactofilin family)